MLRRLRNRQRGFTLIELLIVVAIIGIIAALLIPNFLDALQKAKQKRTASDMRNSGTAWMSWWTDINQAGAAGVGGRVNTASYSGGSINTALKLSSYLVPQYIQDIPQKDGWKTDYNYWGTTNIKDRTPFMVRSAGRDGTFTTANGSFAVTAFDPTDYDQDIAWADGFFVRWPANISPGGGT